MTEFYTPFYEWIAEREDLSLSEALVLCRIKRWGNEGCYEKYSTIAQKLKLSRRKVIEAVNSLIEKGYIKRRYKTKNRQRRLLTFDFSKTYLPLMDKKPVHDIHQLGADSAETGAPHAPEPVRHVHHTISSTKPEEIIYDTAEVLTDFQKRQNREANRQRLLNQLGEMKK